MTLDQVVNEAMKWIIPALPYLVKGIKISGKKGAESLGEAGAGKLLKVADALWRKLTGKKKASSKLTIAAKQLSKTPKDKDWQILLKKEIKTLLKADPALLTEVAALLKIEVLRQTVAAKRNVKLKVRQTNSTRRGVQSVVVEDNRDVDIAQTIKT